MSNKERTTHWKVIGLMIAFSIVWSYFKWT